MRTARANRIATAAGMLLAVAFTAPILAQTRETLPVPDPPFKGKIGLRASDSVKDFPAEAKAPEGAPNVLLILTDDVGFGATSTFGGPIPTPTFDRLANMGLRFNNFHTTALCSPTRAALLTGRNHHSVATGGIMEIGVGYPGLQHADPAVEARDGRHPEAQRLQHLVVRQEPQRPRLAHQPGGTVRPLADRARLRVLLRLHRRRHQPVGAGASSRTRGRSSRRTDDPDYNFDRDMADRAIRWIRMQKAVAPDKPFFAYYATGTAHAPHHAPKDWIAKFKGKFDHGWDTQRELTFAKQKEMGIIPASTKLTQRSTRGSTRGTP